MNPHFKRKLIHFWHRQIRPILVLILIFTAARSSFVDWNDVPTGSMKPTIFEGDRIFVNKLSYGLKFPYTTWQFTYGSGPQRGDVAVFYSPEDGIRLVKRVIGLPGETITLKDGLVSVDGKPLEYTPATPPLSELPVDQQRGYQFFTEVAGEHSHLVSLANAARYNPSRNGTWVVPAGHYFMLGDNRDNSKDSRYIGFVPRDQILGRANRVIFSLDYNDSFLPRKNRFFHALP